MAQTAVNWLIDEIKNFDSGRSQYYSKVAIYNHAYRMEKEQIMEAVNYGDVRGKLETYLTAEQYYNETYGK
jgi:hypothetical protein